MTSQKTTLLLLISILMFACKPKIPQNDNIYQFRDYISYTTSGIVSTTTKIQVRFTKEIPSWKGGEIIEEKLLTTIPRIEGKIKVVNKRTIEFIPVEKLSPNTEYSVGVHLDKIYEEIPVDFKSYNFQFKTIKPGFSIQTNNIHSYSKKFQYIDGVIRFSDIIHINEAKKIISASQLGKRKNIIWNEAYKTGKYFQFKIDSVQRFGEHSEVLIKWDGKPIKSENAGSNKIKILGANNFKILNLKVVQDNEQYLSINFSDPIKKQQNFDGLVTIKDIDTPKFVVNGNVLKVYYESVLKGEVLVNVLEGIKNTDNYKLKKPFSQTVSFQEIKPKVRLISTGNILPNSKDLKFNFEAVNLQAVDVRIIKIFESNVIQFLQENNLNTNYERAIKRVGRRIAKKRITLINNKEDNTGNWKAYSIDLSTLFKSEPGAIYRVEISFKKEYSLYDCQTKEKASVETLEDAFEKELAELNDELKEEQYWDNLNYRYKKYSYNWKEKDNPCHDAYYDDSKTISQNIVASNLGVIAKRGLNNTYHFAVTDIVSTNKMSDAKVTLYNYQQQKIGSVTTNNEGFAKLNIGKNAALAIVSKGNHTSYIKLLDGHSLSLSRFDVSGTKTQKGIKGYLYGERGVWRPGDSLHLTFMLNDRDNKLPKGHPVKLVVKDPNNKIIYKKVSTNHIHQMYPFTVPTVTENSTGNYNATISVGGAKFHKTLKIETVKPNRLKVKVDFKDKILSGKKPLKGAIEVKWLHGAPAKNIRTEIIAKVSNSRRGFKNYKDYVFSDPTRNYNTEEVSFLDTYLDEQGKGNFLKALKVGKNAPGLLHVNFLVKAYEKGGDFSIDAFGKAYAPFSTFVGLKSPKGNDYGSFYTDEKQIFDIVTVDENGAPVQRKNLEVTVYKIEWRWWWNSSYDNLSSYASNRFHQPYKTLKLKTNSKGKGSFNLDIPDIDRGRFLIRVKDTDSGHATGRTAYFYKNWWDRQPTGDKEAAKMLVFSSDKDQYKVGDIAKITFPSSHTGRALISIENGSEVLEYKWVKTTQGKTKVSIPILPKMSPNVFVNISLLQPHKTTENDLPIRLYGTIPILVEDPSTKLTPVISMPDELKPEKTFRLKVSEKNQKAMSYTIAIVEDGLLDLTRFKTPNAHQQFYAREALGVKTWDLYDDVMGAYSGSIDQVFAIGGDGNASKGKNRKANRFKPVVKYLGPFYLKRGTTRSHNITLPNYIGSVRAMVVASDYKKEAYGSAEKSVTVKKPLMVLATLPRKLSPGEKVTLPVTVFAMDKKVKEVTLDIKLSNGIRANGVSSKKMIFNKTGEKMAYFELDVSKAKGFNTIEVIATGNGEVTKHKIEIQVENPNVVTSKIMDKTIRANESTKIDFSTFGVLNSNTASIEFSTIPQIDFTKRLSYLIQYPHGCIEQTTSSVFPQLYLTAIFDLSEKRKNQIQKNIENGIKRLSYFQRFNGGMSYWQGEDYVNDWGTSYAGHFMLEAEKKGFLLPLTFKSNWIRYQKKAARNWKPKYRYSSDLEQAYRLYTLALAGAADLGAMNRLREFQSLSHEAKWRLAAAYALIGQEEASEVIMNSARLDFKKSESNQYTYGSDARNRAMALETMIMTNNREKDDLVKIIAKDLGSNQWMSTQTTAYSLLAIAKMIQKNGGKKIDIHYTFNTTPRHIKSNKTFTVRNLEVKEGKYSVSIQNNQNNVVYVRIINSGKLSLGKELSEQRGFNVSVSYKDLKGNNLDTRTLKQGQDFVAEISVENQKYSNVNDIALSQVFPSGWEIVNTRFTDFGSTIASQARYTDIRDDRVNFYFNIGYKGTKQGEKTFRVLLNASYLGTYYLPGVQVEAMYDNDYLVRTKGRWVKVTQ
ncbi:MAG: hypothetical protein JXQ93_11865 [Flavobacteriaceae bacterium]